MEGHPNDVLCLFFCQRASGASVPGAHASSKVKLCAKLKARLWRHAETSLLAAIIFHLLLTWE